MFQFTPVSRRATFASRRYLAAAMVSIHARLATGDERVEAALLLSGVSIHARLATGDRRPRPVSCRRSGFQFTPVSRRATRLAQSQFNLNQFQFTPVSRRATVANRRHATRYGFQFTPVSRRATRLAQSQFNFHCRFNSRPSRDGRQLFCYNTHLLALFQFTPVSRRATNSKVPENWTVQFQFTPVSRRATSA